LGSWGQAGAAGKYLFIRFSSIGDIVLTTPLMRCLKNQIENSVIHYLTKPQFAGIITSNPNIDKVFTLSSFSDTLKDLEEENYDYIIDLHNNLRTKRFKSSLKRMSFTVDKINRQKWLMVNLKINRLPDKHIVDRYFETLKLFDIENDNNGLDYYIPEKDNVDLNSLPEEFQNDYLAFVIGAKHATKQLPTDKIISICKELSMSVLLLGGKEDESDGNKIVQALNGNIVNACGKYNLNQSASLIKKSKLVVTHDTGLMHIASAFKKKIISFWGNTIPEFGMYPYLSDENSEIFEIKNLKCRPCSKIGYQKCPKKHFKCMNDISNEAVLHKINELYI